MQKFFIQENQIKNNNIKISGEDYKHIKNVLRLKINDKIITCNKETGDNYLSEIIEFEENIINCKIINKIESNSEANVNITIFQGLPKSDKMELIIQKCTELGVKEITPVDMERCIVKLDNKSANKKIERWQKIAESAAKQCKRDCVCKINNVANITNICNICSEYDIVLVPYENEKNISLKDELDKINIQNLKIAIVIGPEGGFEEKEIELLQQNNAKIITLGKRILRTETVAIVMSSIIMYQFGNLE